MLGKHGAASRASRSPRTRGVDFEARYALPLDVGAFGSATSKLDLRFSGTRLIAFDYNPLVAISSLTVDCGGKFGQTCGNPRATWRLSTRATYGAGPMTVSALHRYLSSMRKDSTTDIIRADHYVDLTTAFEVKPGFTWSVGVNTSSASNRRSWATIGSRRIPIHRPTTPMAARSS